jgi:type IV pilus assembly protein PilO
MADLKRTRNHVKIAIGVMAMIDVVAIVMLLTPIAGSEQLRLQEQRQLWLELKSRQSAPWRGLEKKIPLAAHEIEDFYQDRLPSGYSAISMNLDRLASESGVRMSAEKYGQKEAGISGLERVEVEAELSGDYLQLMRFINALERSRLFFIVNGVELGGEQNGVVKLQIKLETYLRTA